MTLIIDYFLLIIFNVFPDSGIAGLEIENSKLKKAPQRIRSPRGGKNQKLKAKNC